MDTNMLYCATVGALLTHELDAVKRHEWRVLPLTSWLPERIGEQVFIWCHVPLIAALLWFGDRPGVRLGLAVFAVAHVGLHWVFRTHPAYEFNNRSSWGLILLAGLCGGAYVASVV